MAEFRINEEVPDDVLVKYPSIVRKLLHNRGIKNDEEAENFLNPDYESQIHDSKLLKDIDKACDRIISAIENNEKVSLFSDYDTDGIPAGVIMHDFFKKINYTNFINYIPHRNKEGFGLNIEAIESLKNDGVSLIITLDCGISNIKEVDFANENGIDVIITDHHLSNGNNPKACAIVNPKQDECMYPESMLCGSGVAFKLVQALLDRKREEWNVPAGWEKWLLDMVGIATLSDMVPLRGENRVFAHFGLLVLRKTRRIGLQELFRTLRINQRNLTEDDVGFMIGPRINAASRMGIPMDAFRLLSTEDKEEAAELVKHLNSINSKRKTTVATMMREAHKVIKERYKEEKSIIVIGNPDWQPSLLGLLANKLMEEFKCPVFIWGRGDGKVIKGSCRSPESLDVVDLMEKVEEGIFTEVGGHSQAGGFSLDFDNVHKLEKHLENALTNIEDSEQIEIVVDSVLSLDEVNDITMSQVKKLSPFGMDNIKPAFMFKDIAPESIRMFGKGKEHLEVGFRNSKGDAIRAIGFFSSLGSFKKVPETDKELSLIANLEESFFNNRREVRLRIIDIF